MKEFPVEVLARIIRADTKRGVDQVQQVKAQARRDSLTSAGSPARSVFTGVSTDSRTVKVGDCFFAIAGVNFDGHDYVREAFSRGAACAVVDKDIGHAGKPVLKVDDTVTALGEFGSYYRRQGSFKVVAITGSVGKTTTRHIAHHVLSRHYRVFQSPKNYNNEIGLPLTLLGAEPSHQIVLAELGTNKPGEIAYLSRVAQPDVAVVTSVCLAHLAGFGDLEAIVQEKLSIADGLRTDGVLIINADIPELVYAPRLRGREFRTFGRSDESDYHAGNIVCRGLSSSITISGKRVDVPLPGPGNAENAVAAWAVCSQFGLTINDFAQGLRTLPSISMRTELLQLGTVTVLNDCYNANPASMRNALEILARLASQHGTGRDRRVVFVCGDMAELGDQAEALHADLGPAIRRAGVNVLVAVGEFAQVTTTAARQAPGHDIQTECFADTTSACRALHKFVDNHDIVLVKGSRRAKLEMVVEKLRELFLPAEERYPIRQVAAADTAHTPSKTKGQTSSVGDLQTQ